jgi:hypothetical protein
MSIQAAFPNKRTAQRRASRSAPLVEVVVPGREQEDERRFLELQECVG